MLPTLVLAAIGVYWALSEQRSRRHRKAPKRLPPPSKLHETTDADDAVEPNKRGSLMHRAEEKTQVLIMNMLQRAGTDAHRQQQAALVEVEDASAMAVSAADRQQNRQLLVCGATVGLTAAGLLFPPLSLLATPLFAYLSVPVYKQALADLKSDRKIQISAFVAVSTTGMWLVRAKVLAALGLLSARVAEKIRSLTQDRARQTLSGLFERNQSTVFLFRDGIEVEVPLDQAQVGDELVLRAGQLIPIDGVVTHGMAAVDQHQLTGESHSIEKSVADSVLCATFIQRGQLRVRVEKAGSDTLAAQISAILERTTGKSHKRLDRGSRLANDTVAPSLLIVGATLPFYGLSSATALLAAMPGLDMYHAGPIALLSFLEMAAERQILVKDGRSLERLRGVDTVIFDKTGTLTLEEPGLAQIHCFSDLSEDEILVMAAAAEHRQSHPLARAITAETKRRQLCFEDIFESRYEIGFGIAARAGKRLIRIGSERFMAAEKLRLPAQAKALRAAAARTGHTLIYVASGRRVVGAIELRPILRPEAMEVIAELRRRNLTIYVLSGDQEEPTQVLAKSLGIDKYFAGVLPEGKAEIILQLQQTGHKVCFIGDGVNDAIALKQADVSIALRGGTLLATDTAQIVLMNQSLRGLLQLLDMARALERNVNTSFALSLGMATALLSAVLLLNGYIGILLSTGYITSFLVVTNALASRLTYKDKNPEAAS